MKKKKDQGQDSGKQYLLEKEAEDNVVRHKSLEKRGFAEGEMAHSIRNFEEIHRSAAGYVETGLRNWRGQSNGVHNTWVRDKTLVASLGPRSICSRASRIWVFRKGKGGKETSQPCCRR